jgi:hypothetical protein
MLLWTRLQATAQQICTADLLHLLIIPVLIGYCCAQGNSGSYQAHTCST